MQANLLISTRRKKANKWKDLRWPGNDKSGSSRLNARTRLVTQVFTRVATSVVVSESHLMRSNLSGQLLSTSLSRGKISFSTWLQEIRVSRWMLVKCISLTCNLRSALLLVLERFQSTKATGRRPQSSMMSTSRKLQEIRKLIFSWQTRQQPLLCAPLKQYTLGMSRLRSSRICSLLTREMRKALKTCSIARLSLRQPFQITRLSTMIQSTVPAS